MTSTDIYRLLAHIVLLIHFAFVAFVVLGLLIIWLGCFLRWRFVRNFYFRAAHILSMAIVLMESLFDYECPLTIWEIGLRKRGGQIVYEDTTFMQDWIHKIMFFEPDNPSIFTIIYTCFFAVLVLSFIFVRPKLPGWIGKKTGLVTAQADADSNPGKPEGDNDPRDSRD